MSEGQVLLAWAAGTNDESEFRVERDCGSGFAQIGVTPGGATTYSDTSMPNSEVCSYQVKGHKQATCPWTTVPSNTVQLLSPPDSPAVTVTAENAFQLRLDWTDASDEDGYEIESMIFNGAWMPVISIPANQLSYTDMQSINPGTTYTYRVRARRGTIHSAWGQNSATTPAYTPGAATCPLH
jgi:titin